MSCCATAPVEMPPNLPLKIQTCLSCDHVRFDEAASQRFCKHSGNKISEQGRRGCPLDNFILPDDPIERIVRLIESGKTKSDWHSWANVQQAYRQCMAQAAASFSPYPHRRFSGRGIVMVGLGRYFASAYVTIRITRHVGDTLPIELWGLPGETLEDWQAKALDGFGVTVRFPGDDFRKAHVPGWQLKAYAVLNSAFEEVRFSDSDSYPIVNPVRFWDSQQYRDHGAIFFPDSFGTGGVPLPQKVWETMGLPDRQEQAFESGQFFIDKRRCWPALHLANWMNQHSDYYYRFSPKSFHGDKDTFHVAWRYLGVDYAMPDKPPAYVKPAMVQHDFVGEPAFVHRVNGKLSLREYSGQYAEFSTTHQVAERTNPKLPLEYETQRYLCELQKVAPAEAKEKLTPAKILHGAIGLTKSALGIDRAPDEVIAQRKAICGTCPNAIPALTFNGVKCKLCGCALAAKLTIRSEHCPDSPPRWPAVPSP